ncbi:uncharacterized protein LOC116114339 [Pistacia vera]|uniref:uncharacterized protein LOC116114339 n=1 Tax=Pistacia vera TaxID=55513 RepID=UPI001262B4E4|nr:uncharacterized protein LOC116114339 [Pistacia vera]
MAYHSSAFLIPLLLFSFLFHSYALTPHLQVPDKVIDALCDEIVNPELCKTTLKNFTIKSQVADRHELGVITVLLATTQARLTRNGFKEILQNEKDDATKNYLLNCLNDYTVTLDKLRAADLLSNQKDYKGMIKLVNEAVEMSRNCRDGFKNLPSHPSKALEENYQKMVWLNDMALITLHVLGG